MQAPYLKETTMPKYRVCLDASLHGCSAFSTDDEIEAQNHLDAEEAAIRLWSSAEPKFTFRPLLTMELATGSAT